MPGLDNVGRILIAIGGVILLAGVLFLVFERTGLGRLPGDIVIRRENFTIFVPITTMIIISLVLTLIFSLLRRF